MRRACRSGRHATERVPRRVEGPLRREGCCAASAPGLQSYVSVSDLAEDKNSSIQRLLPLFFGSHTGDIEMLRGGYHHSPAPCSLRFLPSSEGGAVVRSRTALAGRGVHERSNSSSSRPRSRMRLLSAVMMASARARFCAWSSSTFSSTVSRAMSR